jgi:hypothetical protein
MAWSEAARRAAAEARKRKAMRKGQSQMLKAARKDLRATGKSGSSKYGRHFNALTRKVAKRYSSVRGISLYSLRQRTSGFGDD